MTDDSMTAHDQFGERLFRFGIYGLFVALAIIYFWFGGMKFTAFEAKGLVGLVEPSPLIGWMYDVFSHRSFSAFLGVIEISIGALILARFVSPKFSVLGGLLSCGLFVTTISFMFSSQGVFAPETLNFPAISVMPGQFLLKDIVMLMASVLVLGESLSEIARRKS